MTNMKLLEYAYNAAVTKWWHYLNIASKNSGRPLGEMATKLENETMADINEIETMIQSEKRKQMATAERRAAEEKARKEAQRRQVIAEAPYVIVVKWRNSFMGEIEYPCKSYKEAEESFEVAKREVHLGNVIEAHVFEQSEGQRVPVMGIMRGDV